ncbi:hypothetical protein [Paracoccus sp. IB05]|uniref:hypothetical protein n=1 Tax=Paracoccus sp. IB05 TaxID=2779367 RepID=UPI0018E84165|nr:hypothetical protein [Paracoccus sp. IB05]MBJ2150544.1 hypothetical protein [Paracoccus sp. IB05]
MDTHIGTAAGANACPLAIIRKRFCHLSGEVDAMFPRRRSLAHPEEPLICFMGGVIARPVDTLGRIELIAAGGSKR